jgi:hypothetical protein
MTTMYDENGYPTDEALDKIATFEGTPATMVAYLTDLFHGGFVKHERGEDRYGEARHEISFITGGWSGAESVLGRLPWTSFHRAGWDSSHRGGLEVYHFTDAQWDEEGFWGRFDRRPGATFAPTPEEELRAELKAPTRAVVDAMIAAWNNAEPDKTIAHPASYVQTFSEMWAAGVGALK